MTIPITHWLKQFKARAMLTQLYDDGWEIVVACANQSNNKMEAKYNSYNGEHLAVVWVVSTFRSYFYGSSFIIVTNH